MILNKRSKNQVSNSKFQVPHRCRRVYGSKFLVPGSCCHAPVSGFQRRHLELYFSFLWSSN